MPDSPLSDVQAKRLIKLYDTAEKEILAEVNRLLLKSEDSYSLKYQRNMLARVRQIRSELLAGSRTWCSEAIPDSYDLGLQYADKLSDTKLLGGFGSIHQQAVQVLADNAYGRLEQVEHIVGRQVDDIARAVSIEASKASVIGYQTTKQAAKRIRENLAEKGITGFVDKTGRQWDMGRYARVLAQETTNGAFRQGTINRLQQHGHDLVRLSSHSGSCPKCTPWQGRTMSLSGRDGDYPSVDEARGAGVFHVGCLHVLSLAPEERDRFIGRLQGKDGEAARQAEISRLAEKWNSQKQS